MWLRADVSQEDELMSREDCAVSACGPVWARVWVLQFTGSAELHMDLLTGGETRIVLTGPRFREHW